MVSIRLGIILVALIDKDFSIELREKSTRDASAPVLMIVFLYELIGVICLAVLVACETHVVVVLVVVVVVLAWLNEVNDLGDSSVFLLTDEQPN